MSATDVARGEPEGSAWDRLGSQLTEFFACVAVVGFTLDGEEKNLMYCRSRMHQCALQDALRDLALDHESPMPVIALADTIEE